MVRSRGLGSDVTSDFRWIEISEDSKTGWSDRENLNLAAHAIVCGDDCRKVSQHLSIFLSVILGMEARKTKMTFSTSGIGMSNYDSGNQVHIV